jgi:hypothetical protein
MHAEQVGQPCQTLLNPPAAEPRGAHPMAYSLSTLDPQTRVCQSLAKGKRGVLPNTLRASFRLGVVHPLPGDATPRSNPPRRY